MTPPYEDYRTGYKHAKRQYGAKHYCPGCSLSVGNFKSGIIKSLCGYFNCKGVGINLGKEKLHNAFVYSGGLLKEVCSTNSENVVDSFVILTGSADISPHSVNCHKSLCAVASYAVLIYGICGRVREEHRGCVAGVDIIGGLFYCIVVDYNLTGLFEISLEIESFFVIQNGLDEV